MEPENECPVCRAAAELTKKIAAAIPDGEDPRVIIAALENVLAAVLTTCAPSLTEAVEEGRRFQARVLNAVLLMHQEEGRPPIGAGTPAPATTVN